MDFSLTEAERDLVGLCRDFAQKEIAVRAPIAWEEARCDTALLREMGELGLLGMLVPEEWGGIGMSTVGFAAALAELGVADQSVAAAFQAHVTMGYAGYYIPRPLRRMLGKLVRLYSTAPGTLRRRRTQSRLAFARSHAAAVGFIARRR